MSDFQGVCLLLSPLPPDRSNFNKRRLQSSSGLRKGYGTLAHGTEGLVKFTARAIIQQGVLTS